MAATSDFEAFLKKNKKKKENAKYVASKDFVDTSGKPIEWEIRHITTDENDAITKECLKRVPVPGRPGQYTRQLDEVKYSRKLVAASVVYPDLNNKALQDSYGVMKPEDLIGKMIDDAGEYNQFLQFINSFNNFTSLQEDVDEAKNS